MESLKRPELAEPTAVFFSAPAYLLTCLPAYPPTRYPAFIAHPLFYIAGRSEGATPLSPAETWMRSRTV